MTDTAKKEVPNNGGYLLKNWVIICNDINGNGKISKFNKWTKINSPTGDSGATSFPPIGDSFMYIKTISNNNGYNVFCSFERFAIIQYSNITFSYDWFPAGSTKSKGRFRIQLLLIDNTWSTRYNISKNDLYSDTSTEGTLVNLIFTVQIYGNKLIYDKIDSAYADMCFSNITITHSVY